MCVSKGTRLFVLVFLVWTALLLVLYQFREDVTYNSRRLLEQPSPSIRDDWASDDELLTDNRPELTEQEWIEDAQRRSPDLPVTFWSKNQKKKHGLNKSCASFPNLLDLEYNNDHWQTLRTSNGTFQLFNAYLDVRRDNSVRILGMLNRIKPNITTYCQFWFEGSRAEPVIVQTVEYKYVWIKEWGNYRQGLYQPYLVTCTLPPREEIPAVVSLVENYCDNPTNLLKIIDNRSPGWAKNRKDFAVCVKGLDFPHSDLSVRLAEWIELLNVLGADKIFMYELEVHPNVSKVLKHYEEEGKIHVSKLKLPGHLPNAPSLQHYYLKKKLMNKRQTELIPYNDCFYKHIYEYKYVVLLDTDEVIIPVANDNWRQLMTKVELEGEKEHGKGNVASYNARNVYFLDDLSHNHGWFEGIPRYMHMLQHVYRAKEFTKPGAYIKSFFSTDVVFTVHNHFPLSCLGQACHSFSLNTSDAQLQHYRSDCVSELKKSCENFRHDSVLDKNIWKFKDTLILRVTRTLRKLGFLAA